MKKQMLSILEGNKTNLSSRQFVGRDLPSVSLLLNKEKQPCFMKQAEGPGQKHSGTTTFFNNGGFTPALVIPVLAVRAHAGYSAGYKCGFTLIELLVVVLIIGILAAVALPQYQKAVWRSRNTQLKTLVKSVGQAREAYYMANGSYPSNFDEMNIDLPLTRSYAASPYFTTAGTDSVRKGEDFLIGISDHYSMRGLWTTGPYKGAGFSISTDGKMICTERRFLDGENKFCERLERCTNKQQGDYWVTYDLP